MVEKKCSKCGNVFGDDNFYKSGIRNGKQKLQSWCKKCFNETIKDKPEYAQKRKEYSQKIRIEVLTQYSGVEPKCACCGEKTVEFLCIDHINGNGTKHRKEMARSGITLYLWLRKNKYPAGFQVMCHNCNMAKGFYGKCPHKK